MGMQKRSNRKKLKIAVLTVGIALVVLILLAVFLPMLLSALQTSNEESDALPDNAFYEPDYEKNIFEDEAYQKLDSSVLYMDFGTGETLTEQNYRTVGVASSFFYTYFQAIINGDAQTYRSLLTDTYIEEKDPPERFTMQMLYDISVNQIQRSAKTEYQGREVTAYYFSVSYRIFHNDGTFRRDIGSNQSITQYYELYAIDGAFLLNAVANKHVQLSP